MERNLDAFSYIKEVSSEVQFSVRKIVVVGCHDGTTIARYKELFPMSSIIGFEPNVTLARVARNALSQYAEITIYDFAISEYDKSAKLNLFSNDATSSFYDVQNYELFNEPIKGIGYLDVQTKRLDSLVSEEKIWEEIDLLHIDTQGSDLSVLKSAQMLLEIGKIKMIRVEVEFQEMYRDQPLVWEVCQFLNELDYTFLDFVETKRRIIKGVSTPIWADAIFVHSNALEPKA